MDRLLLIEEPLGGNQMDVEENQDEMGSPSASRKFNPDGFVKIPSAALRFSFVVAAYL
jgi:hypothetical protein